MMQMSPQALREVEQALERYEREVAATPLSPSTQHTYIHHASSFVRWLKGEFTPSGSL